MAKAGIRKRKNGVDSAVGMLTAAMWDTERLRRFKLSKDAEGWAGGKSSMASKGAKTGTEVLESIFRLVEVAYAQPPDSTQKKIIRGMVGSIIPAIFRNEPPANAHRAALAYGIESVKCRFMVITPRRCGKTISVSMFVCAYMLSCPDSVTCVFSVGKRASGMLMNNVKQMVDKILDDPSYGCKGTIVTSNAETLEVCVDGTLRRMHAYPGSTTTLRGVGGNLVILEEAAFIPEEVIQQIVTPLLEVEGTALCAISTPLDDSNIYSKMAEMRTSTGEKVFEVLRVEMACQKCVETLADPTMCPHVDVVPPAWKDQNKRKVSEALYGGKKELLLRETMGIVYGAQGQVWPSSRIRGFLSAPRIKRSDTPRLLFTAIDPCGGGSSLQAAVTLAVIGLSSDQARAATEASEGSIGACMLLKTKFTASADAKGVNVGGVATQDFTLAVTPLGWFICRAIVPLVPLPSLLPRRYCSTMMR